jgi:phenylpyruvate tautomerase PptA (4-oxalocrotonate tautomerase family)
MPMIDLTIPEGALTSEAEAKLIKEITNILISAEGFDPANELVQSVSVAFVQRPSATFVGGAPAKRPWYRLTTSVPEGKYTQEAILTLVKEVTEAFARAEGASFEDVGSRLWVFPVEVPDGTWGVNGAISRIAEIQALLARKGDEAIGPALLARRRRAKALEILEAAADAVRRES